MTDIEKASNHQPVLLDEVVAGLSPKTGRTYLDGTFGGGGHSWAILEISQPSGRVIAIDRDPGVKRFADQLTKKYPKRFRFYPIAYDEIDELTMTFAGIVLDLGLSADQLEQSGRGFSFQVDEPLDMRFNPTLGQNAAQLLGQASRSQLEYIFRVYAEDRYAKRLAEKIATSRRSEPIRTTKDFVRLVGTEDPKVLAPLFQALRIAVNSELEVLKKGLQMSLASLEIGGVLAVISFHSLEDRIVKQFFREAGQEPVTKKPIVPTDAELRRNPRSRSAKLRLLRRIT